MKYVEYDLKAGHYLVRDLPVDKLPIGAVWISDADYTAWPVDATGSKIPAMGYPPVPLSIYDGANNSIKAQIAALDLKRIRPLAEGDTAYLAQLNTQIAALRAQLK